MQSQLSLRAAQCSNLRFDHLRFFALRKTWKPKGFPTLVHAAGVLGLPDGPNLVQTGQGGLLVRGMVDRLQVVGERLLVLVRHVLQRVAYHMHDASLVFRQRIRRRDGVLDAAQSIRADHENVLHAAILAGSYAAVTAHSARSARTGWKLRCSYALSFSPMVMLRTSFRPSSLSPSIT